MVAFNEDSERASVADEEELKSLVYHKSIDVISRVIENRNLTEELALVIANRRNISPKALEFLAQDKRWENSYSIKLAICRNPKTPQRLALAIIKNLKIFDLADLTRNPIVPATLRLKIELHIAEKIPAMPLGIKTTLARRASSNVLMRLMEDGMKQVVSVCLDSPYMTEATIYKIVSLETTSPQVIRLIANHSKWSSRYQIRRALIVNNYTPLSCVVSFLKNMKASDLKELYSAPEVPLSTKPFIYKELHSREES